MRSLGAAIRDVAALVPVAVAACSLGEVARPQGTSAPGTCDAAYPAPPYGTDHGRTLADLAFDVLDESAQSVRFSLHEAHEPCARAPRVLLLRVHAGFCGTCRWQAAHLVETLGELLAARVRVLDLVVRDDDGDPPVLADRALWRTRQDRPASVALGPGLRFVKPRAVLPRVLVVDPRTMKILDALDDPQPTALLNAVTAAVATIDGRRLPAALPEARIDGLLTREQHEMLRDMRLLSGPPPRDPTNHFGDDEGAAELGRQLFDDKLLSPGGMVSCERCHERGRTFQDERSFGPLPPLSDVERFAPSGKPGDPALEGMTALDRDAVTGVYVNVGKAIAAFERSFRATELPFEMYLRGTTDALDPLQKAGLVAFFESGCAQCHWGNRLTDDAFHVLRFPTGRDDLAPDRGRIDGYAKRDASEFRAEGRWSDAPQARRKPPNAAQLGGFKTPALRGVAVTAPYGHGGSVPSLRMAIELHRTAGLAEGSRYTTGVAEPWLVDFPAEKVDALVAVLSTMGLGFVR